MRRFIPLRLILPFALLPMLASPGFAEEDAAPTPVEIARTFIEHLAQDDLPAARSMLDDAMLRALPKGKLKEIWQQLLGRAGAFEATGRATPRKVEVHDVVDLDVTFERQVLVLRVALNADGKVAGFFLIGERPREEDPSAVVLETKTGQIRGTFDLPEGKGPWPVVLVIAGSGPTDRDGNAPGLKNDHLKLLGQGLAARGVAALRYDKRAVAGSAAAGPTETDLRIETYAEDAAAWVSKLRKDPRFSRVVILGHSEGALVGMLAAKTAPPDAFVSIAGPGRPAGGLILEQLKPKLTDEIFAAATKIVQALATGKTVDEVPAVLQKLFRPSVQPYLISWFAHDPAEAILKLEVPMLILQGTTDVQVSVADAERLAQSAPGARMRTFPGMNHVMKEADTAAAQMRAYADPGMPVMPALLDEVSAFALEPAASPPEPEKR